MDSLEVVNVFIRLEEKFDIRITDEYFTKMTRTDQVIDYIVIYEKFT
jgi:acyl carrier protein